MWYGVRYDPTRRIAPRDEPVRSFVAIFVQNDAIGQSDCVRQSFDAAHEPPADIDLRHVMAAQACSCAYASQALIDVVQAYVNQRYVVPRPSSVAKCFHREVPRGLSLEQDLRLGRSRRGHVRRPVVPPQLARVGPARYHTGPGRATRNPLRMRYASTCSSRHRSVPLRRGAEVAAGMS